MQRVMWQRLCGVTMSSCLALLVGCSDEPGQGDGSNMADMGGGTSQEMGGASLANGAACGQSSACLSGYCVSGVCVTQAGAPCNASHCATGELCEAGVCKLPDGACDAAQQCGAVCCTAGEQCVDDDRCVALCADDRLPCEGVEGASECCAASAACLFGGCVELGSACNDAMPCARDEFCEPTLSRCVPRSADPNQCIYVPPVEAFAPVEAWAWTGSTVSPEYDQVMASPVVGNLTDDSGDGKIDGDDIPDVVFTTFRLTRYSHEGVLRVVSGDDGREIWSSTGLPEPFLVAGSTTPALADIDGDGIMEIIVAIDTTNGVKDGDVVRSGVMAVEHDGTIKWQRSSLDMPAITSNSSGGPAVANVDGEGPPEIIVGNALLNADGDPICLGIGAGSLPSLADMDLDGRMEIVGGGSIWRVDDATKTDGTGCSLVSSGPGGSNAIANLDEDPEPEILVVGGGSLSLIDQDGSTLWTQLFPLDAGRIAEVYSVPDCDAAPAGDACVTDEDCGGRPQRCIGRQCYLTVGCYPGGGPPTIADFDGDGEPEIAVAGRWYYLVYERDGSILWAHSTKDYSSGATGSSVFDFEGDGKAEVVYNDEQFLRVYRGSGAGMDADGDGYNDPVILLEEPNTSGTLVEYPLIVDVDNDGNAEIVVSANNYQYRNNPDVDGTKGIRVFRDSQNNWVGTRRIWNQHTYHVTNIDENGQVPLREEANWTVSYLNNYRQNVQGEGLFNAPDLLATELEVNGTTCAGPGMTIAFTLENEGSIGVRKGALSASIYVGISEPLLKVGVVQNSEALPPGGRSQERFVYMPDPTELNQTLQVRVVVDEDEEGLARHNECDESNNEVSASTLCASDG